MALDKRTSDAARTTRDPEPRATSTAAASMSEANVRANVDDIPSHKPLPRLSMAVLRSDIKRRRLRMAGQLALGAVAIALGFFALRFAPMFRNITATNTAREPSNTVPEHVGLSTEIAPGISSTPELEEPTASEEEPNIVVEQATPIAAPTIVAVGQNAAHDGEQVYHFGQATGFRAALVAMNIPGEEADTIIDSLTNVLDFRRCHPEDEIRVLRQHGLVQRLLYRSSATQMFEVSRNGNRFVAQAVVVPVARTPLVRGGVIQSSLGAAFESVGLGRQFVGTFLEVFERRINFATETRSGDAFRIVVTEERLDGRFLRFGQVLALEYRSQRHGTLTAFFFDADGDGPQRGEFCDDTGRAINGGWLRTPVRYDHISSPFDPRRMHPVLHRIHPHNGIDYAAGVGTPVWAAGDGAIIFIGPRGPNGNLIGIRHAGGFESYYAHLSRFAGGLRVGAPVTQRQVIGYVGSTGRSTGPHLHFGLKRGSAFVDPARELNGPGRTLPGSMLSRYRSELARLRGLLNTVAIPQVRIDPAARAQTNNHAQLD